MSGSDVEPRLPDGGYQSAYGNPKEWEWTPLTGIISSIGSRRN
jgi:hypothetical protein